MGKEPTSPSPSASRQGGHERACPLPWEAVNYRLVNNKEGAAIRSPCRESEGLGEVGLLI